MVNDPRIEVDKYLASHQIIQLFETLTAQLIFHKPENPRQFVVKYLEEMKISGGQPLLTAQDLATIFGMLDMTSRGVVSAEQANSSLRSILGHDSSLIGAGVQHGEWLKEEEFVAAMTQALRLAVPYAR